jgi:hypothetical protein
MIQANLDEIAIIDQRGIKAGFCQIHIFSGKLILFSGQTCLDATLQG